MRELILDVLGALDWGGPVRVAGVSVHIYGVPPDGTWRDGTVRVETIVLGFGWGEPCAWPRMTQAQAIAEATERIEYADSRFKVAPARLAVAREVVRAAAEQWGEGS